MHAWRSETGKAPLQIANNFVRLIEPLTAARRVGDLEARHFGLSALLHQRLPVNALVLRVDALDVQRQACHFLPHSGAKRAGCILIQRKRFALLVDCDLRGWRAAQTFGPGDGLLEQHDRAEDDAEGAEEEADKRFHMRF